MIKYLFILFTITVQAQNVWYVDRDATGANTGRSWTDAWVSLDSCDWTDYSGVNWNLIGDGDTIYVSGGTDSTAYYPIGGNNWFNGIRGNEPDINTIVYTFNDQVVIAPAWHEGHNGDVYFVPRNDNTYSIFSIWGVANVKITGFNFVDTRTNNTTQENGMMI